MLTLAPGTKVYLAVEPVDLRRRHDGLCAIVRGQFALDPFTGHLFAFVGRRRDRIKIFFWDRGSFVLYYKRLSRGQFMIAPEDRVVMAIPALVVCDVLDSAPSATGPDQFALRLRHDIEDRAHPLLERLLVGAAFAQIRELEHLFDVAKA